MPTSEGGILGMNKVVFEPFYRPARGRHEKRELLKLAAYGAGFGLLALLFVISWRAVDTYTEYPPDVTGNHLGVVLVGLVLGVGIAAFTGLDVENPFKWRAYAAQREAARRSKVPYPLDVLENWEVLQRILTSGGRIVPLQGVSVRGAMVLPGLHADATEDPRQFEMNSGLVAEISQVEGFTKTLVALGLDTAPEPQPAAVD
jgi:hypothetical protein